MAAKRLAEVFAVRGTETVLAYRQKAGAVEKDAQGHEFCWKERGIAE